MRPIVTDRVMWSVSLSQLWALQKRLSRSRCRLGCGLGWAQGTVLDGVHIPPWEGAILGGKWRRVVKYRDALPWAVQKQLKLWIHLRRSRVSDGVQMIQREGTLREMSNPLQNIGFWGLVKGFAVQKWLDDTNNLYVMLLHKYVPFGVTMWLLPI